MATHFGLPKMAMAGLYLRDSWSLIVKTIRLRYIETATQLFIGYTRYGVCFDDFASIAQTYRKGKEMTRGQYLFLCAMGNRGSQYCTDTIIH